MSTKTREAQLTNQVLFRYIQSSYEYLRRNTESSIQGNKVIVLNKLYVQRMKSIFNSMIGIEEGLVDFQQLHEWIKNERLKRQDKIIIGHGDQFYFNAQDFTDNQIKYSIDFQKDSKSGSISDLGLDGYASYLPIHFFYNNNQSTVDWGIYISETGIMKLAAMLRQACEKAFGVSKFTPHRDSLFVQIAYQILIRHELEHYKIESFALNAEMFLRKPIYVPYLVNVYAETYNTDKCLEEALANNTVLNSNQWC